MWPALSAWKTAPENFMEQKCHHHPPMLPAPPDHSLPLPLAFLFPHFEAVIEKKAPLNSTLVTRPLSRKSLGSVVPPPSARLTLGSITPCHARGHMVGQLRLGDTGQPLLPIHVSPSPRYTVAFKLQQGTFDLEGEAKREPVTCSKHLREG